MAVKESQIKYCEFCGRSLIKSKHPRYPYGKVKKYNTESGELIDAVKVFDLMCSSSLCRLLHSPTVFYWIGQNGQVFRDFPHAGD